MALAARFAHYRLPAALAAFLCATALAADKPEGSVNQVIALLRADLAAKRDDKQTAKTVSKLKLSERLDPVVIEHMESEGAGPRTVEELEALALATEGLVPPTPPPDFPHPPIPSRDEMTAAIRHARLSAASYAASLPDFLCEENVTRFENMRGRGWEKRDVLGLRLSYENQIEQDKLVTLNGRSTKLSLSAVAGAQTSGEFGALMLQVLDPASKGKFHWDHWTLLRNRPTQVYSYRIDVQDSHYRLAFGTYDQHSETTPAMEGTLYLDGATNDIMRIANHAADIEPGFPVRVAATRLDYEARDVGGKTFNLPIRAETRMETTLVRTRNAAEFSGYRKFEGESTITFGDDPDTPPPPKIKH